MADKKETKQEEIQITQEQLDQLPKYAEQWIANAFNTATIEPDKEKIVEWTKKLYTTSKLKEPNAIGFVRSPLALALTGSCAAAVWYDAKAYTEKEVLTAIDKLMENIFDAGIKEEVKRVTLELAKDNIVKRKSSEKKKFDVERLESLMREIAINYCSSMWNGGNQWSGWVCYLSAYADVFNILKDVHDEKFLPYRRLCELSGPRMVHANFCVFSDRPLYIHRNAENQPHNSSGAYIEYRDGWKLYALNGIQCEAKHVEVDPEKYPAEEILKETSVDLRRELIRRVGIERVLASLNPKVIDTKGDYELLNVSVPGVFENAIYLKMTNPSIGVFHLEGVARECKTVQQALNWRAANLIDHQKETWNPSQLT